MQAKRFQTLEKSNCPHLNNNRRVRQQVIQYCKMSWKVQGHTFPSEDAWQQQAGRAPCAPFISTLVTAIKLSNFQLCSMKRPTSLIKISPRAAKRHRILSTKKSITDKVQKEARTWGMGTGGREMNSIRLHQDINQSHGLLCAVRG